MSAQHEMSDSNAKLFDQTGPLVKLIQRNWVRSSQGTINWVRSSQGTINKWTSM